MSSHFIVPLLNRSLCTIVAFNLMLISYCLLSHLLFKFTAVKIVSKGFFLCNKYNKYILSACCYHCSQFSLLGISRPFLSSGFTLPVNNKSRCQVSKGLTCSVVTLIFLLFPGSGYHHSLPSSPYSSSGSEAQSLAASGALSSEFLNHGGGTTKILLLVCNAAGAGQQAVRWVLIYRILNIKYAQNW